MKKLLLGMGAAVVMITPVACSSDEPDTGTADGTSTVVVDDETAGDELSQAKTVVVQYFEARAVNEYARALDASEGAAATAVEWDRAVNGIEAVDGTPYEVEPVPSPNVRVQIDALTEDGDDRWLAEGFIELSERPSGVASTTTTAPPEGEPPLPPTTFVTDLVFSAGDDGIVLEDYRFDDVAYPVSELYVDPAMSAAGGSDGASDDAGDDAASTDTAPDDAEASAELVLMHRDVDGTAQYLLDVDDGGLPLTSATVFDGTEPPPPPATGDEVEVFSDAVASEGTADDAAPADADADADADGAEGAEAGAVDTLIVRPAFPATTDATLRIQLGDPAVPDQSATIDLELPGFPEVSPRQTNVIRNQMSETTTTTSTTTTTAPPPPDVTVTVVPPSVTVVPPSTEGPTTSSTSSSSTTSTTAP